jgi:hypothetical protein
MADVLAWACIAVFPLALADCCCMPLKKRGQSDRPGYFGTAWSLQETVVALAYPLVVSCCHSAAAA